MEQRFLDPAILAGLSGLDLVAKTVVEGFVSGLHRSPDFGFSQEFAEYRAYSQGDDLRHVDWNVFARTDRCYLKRYRGETNTQLMVLLDASASMAFGSRSVSKLSYARFLAASLCYLAHRQRDAAGLLVFDDEIRDFAQPSSRHGQLAKLLHVLEHARPGARTDYSKPFFHLQQFIRRRGLVAVISDFYEDPACVIRTMEPLRHRGSELILFHVLDPGEIQPAISDPVLLVDMETGETVEVSPAWVRDGYGQRRDAHVEALRSGAQMAGMDYFLMNTARPLDEGLGEYLSIRQGRL